MLMPIGAVLSIIVPFLIYRWILKGEERTVTNKEYVKTFLLSATVYMIPIIVIQVSFDFLLPWDPNTVTTIGQSFFTSFIRASLLEEGAKLFFVYRCLKRRQELGMKETILLAGIIGIGFGFLEKLVMGEAALILNAFFPGHMLFQWLMGYFLYKAMRAEGTERKKLFALSYLVPFLLHGVWDLGLFLSDVMEDSLGMPITGIVILFVMVILYIVAFVKSIKTVKRTKA